MSSENRRPLAVVVALVVLAFLGLTAVGGGIEMLVFPRGNQFVKPKWLDDLPLIDTWVIPGLILGIVFGLGSGLVAFGLLRKPSWAWLDGIARRTGHHWSWAAAILLGAGLVLWIVVEVVMIPERSVVEAIYAAVGAFLVAVPLLPSVRRYLALPPPGSSTVA